MHNKKIADRNDVEDILANEDDNFMEDLNDLEDPESTGLYFNLWSIRVSNLILNQMVCIFRRGKGKNRLVK